MRNHSVRRGRRVARTSVYEAEVDDIGARTLRRSEHRLKRKRACTPCDDDAARPPRGSIGGIVGPCRPERHLHFSIRAANWASEHAPQFDAARAYHLNEFGPHGDSARPPRSCNNIRRVATVAESRQHPLRELPSRLTRPALKRTRRGRRQPTPRAYSSPTRTRPARARNAPARCEGPWFRCTNGRGRAHRR